MESNHNNSSSLVRLIPVVIIFAGLLGLYYLYQYLFGPKTDNAYPLITSTQTAQVNSATPLTFSTTQLAPLYEGGEFTISTWIYISNWSHRAGFNKSILRIGAKPPATTTTTTTSHTNAFDTIRMYLGGRKPKLQIRFHTKEQSIPAGASAGPVGAGASTVGAPTVGASTVGATAGGPPTTGPELDSLGSDNYNMTFNLLQTESGLLDHPQMCDLPEIDMQRWVNITVAVNGKTVDVYVDGKLARSCILRAPYKVDSNGYTGYALENGGFGGKISTTTMYDSALNPETVYKNYMAGPEPITTIGGLLGSFFAPNLKISISN
jgi:hypothetical protein